MTSVIVQPDHIDADRALALAGLLDRPSEPGQGDRLPMLWHLVYFLPRPTQAELGPDGHPRVGFPTPPRPDMRRMFAGGRVEIGHGLRIGDDAVATTSIVASTDKLGRSGPMRLVTTRTEITVGERVVITDERDIVYLEPAARRSAAAPARQAEPTSLATVVDRSLAHRHIAIDPVLLFRFSALTYNAHRIHYDLAFARDVEGHADLVVHGPLQALVMAELAAEVRPVDRCVFTYRLRAPLYLGQGMVTVATTERDVCVMDQHGRTTATATIDTMRETP